MPLQQRSSFGRSMRYGYSAQPLTRDQTRGVFGQVMGLVAATVAFLALGAYVGRHLAGGSFIIFFLGGIACVFGLNWAAARGREQLAVGLLFGVGLLLGLALAPLLVVYAKADPGALYQAAGCTTLFVGGLGAYGYATRRDLSSWARGLFWALLALIAFGLVTLFVAIPGGNLIYSILGLVVFGAFTMFDFNRLRRANMAMAVPIAASIFLDILNVFLLMLRLFGGGGRS